MIDRVLEHLRTLVAADTSDPAAALTREHPAIAYCVQVLEAFGCEVTAEDLGGGCVNLLAIRGTPGESGVLFNCHLDTVRADPGWTRNPFTLSVEGGKAFGLGSCDIKGAAACLFAAIESVDRPIAVLLTTDEEGGKGRCVEHFLKTRGFDPATVVVAEPTRCGAVAQHRGFASFEVTFAGDAGHTSAIDAAAGSATHAAIRWANGALALADAWLADERFNIGLIEGGTASNVVASSARIRFGFRPSPRSNEVEHREAVVRELKSILPGGGKACWSDRFLAPPLAACDASLAAVERWGVARGPDVDFWTEAALFAAAGLPALVIGPGDIAQAHAADEFVELTQLERCADVYKKIVQSGLPASPSASAEGAACAP